MDFSTWIRTWLTRHPLKELMGHDPARYTAEVMEKVKAVGQPVPTPSMLVREWFSWPRVGLAVATVAAGLGLMIITSHHAEVQLAEKIVQESSMLAELDEPSFVPVANGDADALAQEMETADTVMLAESIPSDEQWLDQTLSLLDQLDEDDANPADSSDSSEEEWLNELQLLDDDSELSANS